MRVTPLLVCLVALPLFGCSPNLGPQTYAYLSGEHDLYAHCVDQIRDMARLVPPVLQSSFDKNIREREAQRQRGYLRAVNAYYTLSIQLARQRQTIIADAQNKIGALDARGVEPDAVQLVQEYQRFLGDRANLFAEYEALIRDEQKQFQIKQQPRLALDAVKGIEAGLADGNYTVAIVAFANAALKDQSADIDRQTQIRAHVDRFQELGTTAERDLADARTLRSQLMAHYENRYPNQQWEALIRPSAQEK